MVTSARSRIDSAGEALLYRTKEWAIRSLRALEPRQELDPSAAELQVVEVQAEIEADARLGGESEGQRHAELALVAVGVAPRRAVAAVLLQLVRVVKVDEKLVIGSAWKLEHAILESEDST